MLSQKIDGTLDKKWNVKRTLLTSAYGGLFIGAQRPAGRGSRVLARSQGCLAPRPASDGAARAGPVGHTWYEVLDRVARRRFAPGSFSFIATKVVGDEVVFGPVHVAGFFAFMTAAEGGSWQARRPRGAACLRRPHAAACH